MTRSSDFPAPHHRGRFVFQGINCLRSAMSVKQLRCRECGRTRPLEPAFVCEYCFGPLEVIYDYANLRTSMSRESIAAGPSTIWRYADLLPAAAVDGDLGTGFTPLSEARNLGRELGLANLYVKNDTLNPTGSFKDRNVAVATAFALAHGFETLSCSSTGNLAGSVEAYGATVVEVDGTYDDVNRLCAELADQHSWGIVNVNLRPFYSEGSKTLLFEVVEQLGWRAPDHSVVPVAAGSLLAKTAKALDELVSVGLLDGTTTRIHAAQAQGCAPISTAIREGADHVTPVKPQTVAKSLAIGNPADGRYAIRAVRQSGGWATAAPDPEILAGMALLAETEGILAETAGGVAVAGLQRLVAEGRIEPDETVVLCVTGSGLKTPELFSFHEGRRLHLSRAHAADAELALAGALA